ncbi:MAG TPA: hypothetical protein VKG65_07260 [Terriglobales bacterium]|nr:hypothetical protein [Terriglobales bacterium]
MLTSTPVGLDEITIMAGASAAAYLTLEMKAPSGEAATPAPDRDQREDLDGCDVEIAEATSDEDLPASEGGVA